MHSLFFEQFSDMDGGKISRKKIFFRFHDATHASLPVLLFSKKHAESLPFLYLSHPTNHTPTTFSSSSLIKTSS
jgi:hypothetical protein